MNNIEKTKLKYVANIFTGNSIPDNKKDSYTGKNIPYIPTKELDVNTGNFNYENGLSVNENDGFRIAPAGSTLMCIEGGSAGKKIGILDRSVAFVNKLCCFEGTNINNKYLYYCLQSMDFTEQFKLNMTGLIGGVSTSTLKNLFISCPRNLNTQLKIVEYLDKKINLIDALIKNQNEQIENLKSYKQSLIFESVTKGINKNIRLKDSCSEWIGNIPEHWNISMLSSYFSHHKEKNVGTKNTNLLSLSYGNIIRKNINTRDGLLPENFDTYNIIYPGNIVLRLTDLQNDHKSLRVGFSYEQGIITSAYVTIKLKNTINVSKYFYYVIHSFDIKKGFYGMGSGVRQGLNFDGIKKLVLPIPPVKEQKEIVKFLDIKCDQIERLIRIKQSKIEELLDYKKSLIYECITGKKELIN